MVQCGLSREIERVVVVPYLAQYGGIVFWPILRARLPRTVLGYALEVFPNWTLSSTHSLLLSAS